MTRPGRRRADLHAEVVELLQDEPELLAIADAVRATRHEQVPARARPRRGLILAIAATLVASVVAGVALLAPGPGSHLGLVDEAEAAIGEGTVIHAVVIRRAASDEVIDLRTGTSRPSMLRFDVWLQTGTNDARLVQKQNGSVVASADHRVTRADVHNAGLHASVGAEVALLLVTYRDELARQDVVTVSASRRILRVGEGATGVEVSLGPDFLPQTLTPSHGAPFRLSEVELRDSTPRIAATQPYAGHGSIVDETLTTLEKADRGTGIELGPALGGVPFVSAARQGLVRRTARGPVRGLGFQYDYGRPSRPFVELDLAPEPEPAYSFVDGRTMSGNPVPPSGSLDLHRLGAGGDAVWIGQFRARGHYVLVRASSRSLLLAAARALTGTA